MIGRPGESSSWRPAETRTSSTWGRIPCWPFPRAATAAGPDTTRSTARPRSTTSRLSVPAARATSCCREPSFGWRFRYPDFFEHLETEYQRVHHDEHLVVYDLPATRPKGLDPPPVARAVLGTYAAHRTGPPAALVTELGEHPPDRRPAWRPDLEARVPALPATDRRRLRRLRPRRRDPPERGSSTR